MGHDKLLIIGTIVHVKTFGQLEIMRDKCIEVDLCSGKIISIQNSQEEREIIPSTLVIKLTPQQFICPGFIDTHHHAPQTSNLGLGLDRELLQWLDKYTFPRERSFGTRSDESIRSEYSQMAKRNLRGGTTTCVYFGSLQVDANKILVDEVLRAGQRAFIGKVCMDQNSPSDYVESTEDAIIGTNELISYISLNGKYLIKPVVTPRFAPTCCPKLMKELGQVANSNDCHIQTHVSENLSEVAWVRDLFPSNSSYTEVYDAAGLLTRKTILAHAIYLEDAEKDLIRARESSISHCPNSNFALSSGCLNVRDLLCREIKVSLGTDVSGGYSQSMLDACRQAIIASKVIHFQDRNVAPLTAVESFSLATLNGAIALGLESVLGNFEPGKFFDALIVDNSLNPQIPSCAAADETDLMAEFEKFIFCGDDRCIKNVFVRGQEIDIHS